LDVSASGSNVTSVGVSSLVGALGVSSPAMTAGALLLTYQVGLALFVSLGPLLILCLKASAEALKVCAASGDRNCRIYCNACSLPVRVQ
jgi:hypothetical protein